MNIGEGVQPELLQTQTLVPFAREQAAWTKLEAGLLQTLRGLGGIAAEATFATALEGAPDSTARLTTLLAHMENQIKIIRSVITPSNPEPKGSALLHSREVTSGNGKTLPFVVPNSNGNQPHTELHSEPFTSSLIDKPQPNGSNGCLSEPLHEPLMTTALAGDNREQIFGDKAKSAWEELGQGLGLSPRESLMTKVILESAKPGEWFAAQSIDFSSVMFNRKGTKHQAYSILVAKLETAGILETIGRGSSNKRYRLLKGLAEINNAAVVGEPSAAEPEQNSTTVPRSDGISNDQSTGRTDKEDISALPDKKNTVKSLEKIEDPFATYTGRLLEPKILECMEIGAKPQITILADNKVCIGEETFELSKMETAVVNILLHHRERLRLSDMAAILGELPRAELEEYKAALHKINNRIDKILGTGIIEREGQTKSKSYRLRLDTVVADVRLPVPISNASTRLRARRQAKREDDDFIIEADDTKNGDDLFDYNQQSKAAHDVLIHMRPEARMVAEFILSGTAITEFIPGAARIALHSLAGKKELNDLEVKARFHQVNEKLIGRKICWNEISQSRARLS